MSGDQNLARVREYGRAALFVNGGYCFGHRQLLRNRLRHPQPQHMTLDSRHFHAGDHIEGIPGALLICPQAGIQHVMIGDRNHIQKTAPRHIIKKLPRRCNPITRAGMHVNVREAIAQGVIQGFSLPFRFDINDSMLNCEG